MLDGVQVLIVISRVEMVSGLGTVSPPEIDWFFLQSLLERIHCTSHVARTWESFRLTAASAVAQSVRMTAKKRIVGLWGAIDGYNSSQV